MTKDQNLIQICLLIFSVNTYMKKITYIILFFVFASCSNTNNNVEINKTIEPAEEKISKIKLDLDQANRLAQLPIACIKNPLPYKAGHTIAKEEDLDLPQNHHPAFYGCFDWHSAVHGHWSLVYLLKKFPGLENRDSIKIMLDQNLSAKNILKEVEYFSMNRYTKSFERTYGWAWLLKLAEELHSWDDADAQKWYNNLKPLTKYISEAYIEYLPKLVYPIRVGEHSNTAFGLSFAYDYAINCNDIPLANSIRKNAIRFYNNDKGCPITWEPSGYDFLSPCLQEIDIMRKILNTEQFDAWLNDFMPELASSDLELEPGKIIDRSDGKLVHLDGLNFSRAWCLYPLVNNSKAQSLADHHLTYSLNKITDGDYAGQHWLASFALYAFKTQSN